MRGHGRGPRGAHKACMGFNEEGGQDLKESKHFSPNEMFFKDDGDYTLNNIMRD